MLEKRDMNVVRTMAREATRRFIADLGKIEREVSFEYKMNPGRHLTREESERLLRIIKRVRERRRRAKVDEES